MMVGVSAAFAEKWMLSAIAISAAAYWKIYPLAFGLLLILIVPKKYTWRLVLALVVMGLLPFLFQKTSYVIDQYHLWYTTRTGDNRSRTRRTSRRSTCGICWFGLATCRSTRRFITSCGLAARD